MSMDDICRKVQLVIPSRTKQEQHEHVSEIASCIRYDVFFSFLPFRVRNATSQSRRTDEQHQTLSSSGSGNSGSNTKRALFRSGNTVRRLRWWKHTLAVATSGSVPLPCQLVCPPSLYGTYLSLPCQLRNGSSELGRQADAVGDPRPRPSWHVISIKSSFHFVPSCSYAS